MCNFFSIALVARMLGTVLQGEWTLYINAYTLGTLALSFGLPPAINHFVAAGKVKRENLLGQLLSFSLLAGAVFFLGVFILSKLALGDIMLPSVLSVNYIVAGLTFHFTLLLLNQLLGSVLFSEKKFQTAAVINVIGALLLLLAYFYFSFQEKVGSDYFLIFIITNVVVLFFQSVLYLYQLLTSKSYKFKFIFFSKSVLLMLFTFASWAYVTNFLQFLNYRIDVWFIKAFEQKNAVASESQLGIYSIAVSLAQLIWLLPNAFHSIIFTDISEGEAAVDKKKVYKWSVILFLLAIVLAILGYFLSFWLIPVFFTREYLGVIQVFPYLLPGIVLFAPSILWSAYFAGKNRVDINFKSSGLGFLACLAMNILLIPLYGIIGAAIASSISYIISALYLYYVFCRLNSK